MYELVRSAAVSIARNGDAASLMPVTFRKLGDAANAAIAMRKMTRDPDHTQAMLLQTAYEVSKQLSETVVYLDASYVALGGGILIHEIDPEGETDFTYLLAELSCFAGCTDMDAAYDSLCRFAGLVREAVVSFGLTPEQFHEPQETADGDASSR